MKETIKEIIVSDIGDISIIVRPQLPFLAEGVRVLDGEIAIFGEDRRVRIDLTDHQDKLAAIGAVDQILLSEYSETSAAPVRETDIEIEKGPIAR